MLKIPAKAQGEGSRPALCPRGPEHTGPWSLPAPQPLRPALSQRPSPPRMPHSTRRAPCSSPAPKNRASDSAQPALTHVGLTTMPRGPCPARPTSASHIQQQSMEQLQLFPLQYPTPSLPARRETGAHKHDQEKQFSFGAAELSRARSSRLGWPSPPTAAVRPSPPSSPSPLPPAPSRLVPVPMKAPAAPSPPQKPHRRKRQQLQPLPAMPPQPGHTSLACATDCLRIGAQHPKQDLLAPDAVGQASLQVPGSRLAMPEAAPR